MWKVIRDVCTERDGSTYDSVRILGIIGFIIYNAITIIHSIHHCNGFDPVNYSSGLSILLGTIAAGVTLKSSREN